ncbi:uncharacterized protein LOC128990696 [Macrosteles quadrilineatus]|uniref:uncharacterized protein LOC128990696 n=1 Tax=Macrosteles quadrilineatus TaxID=74068 RepID=UPI0023E147AF|nr:uncharacterized protein LOC128990696 [Macrosteles quadrilineatus]
MAALCRLCIVCMLIYLQVCSGSPFLKFAFQRRPAATAVAAPTTQPQTTTPGQPQNSSPVLWPLLQAFIQKKRTDLQLLITALTQTLNQQNSGQIPPAQAGPLQNLLASLQAAAQGQQGVPGQSVAPGVAQNPGQAPGQQVPGQQTSVQQPSPQQPSPQQSPVQQTPAQQTPVQQTPAQQAPAQQAPAQQNPVQTPATAGQAPAAPQGQAQPQTQPQGK